MLRTSLPLPSPLTLCSQSYKLIWSKTKIKKKTYKNNNRKSNTSGRGAAAAPRSFRSFLNAVSLPPREYRLLAKSLAAS